VARSQALARSAYEQDNQPLDVDYGRLILPAVKDLVPPDHVTHFARWLVREKLDLSLGLKTCRKKRGYSANHPAMVTRSFSTPTATASTPRALPRRPARSISTWRRSLLWQSRTTARCRLETSLPPLGYASPHTLDQRAQVRGVVPQRENHGDHRSMKPVFP
jgi:hypothetical protein